MGDACQKTDAVKWMTCYIWWGLEGGWNPLFKYKWVLNPHFYSPSHINYWWPIFASLPYDQNPIFSNLPLNSHINTLINSPSQISASCSSWLQQHWARQEHHSFVPTYDWLIVYLYNYNNYMGILLSAFGKEHFVCSVQTENSTLSSQLWCIEHLDYRISGWRGWRNHQTLECIVYWFVWF